MSENIGDRADWIVIGTGHIGAEIKRQLRQEHVAERLHLKQLPSFTVNSRGIFNADGTPSDYEDLEDVSELPEVSFVAIPSDRDEEAYGFISHILDQGKIAVTAEKGALSSRFKDLQEKSDNFRRLGINAAVGGGTRMLDVAERYATDLDNITQIHLALNGTLSAIFSMVAPTGAPGMSLGQAVEQATKLDFAEPSTEGEGKTPYAVIKEEAEGDIPKKTAIFFNKLGLGAKCLNASELKFKLEEDEIGRAVEEARIRRFIVSLYNASKKVTEDMIYPENDIIGGFDIEQDGWRIVGGFRHVDHNPLFANLANITGPGSGLVVGLGPNESDGVYSLTGPGAGVSPTVNTMIDDYVSRSRAA